MTRFFSVGLALALAACSSGQGAGDASPADGAVDASMPDVSAPDAAEDGSIPDGSIPDGSVDSGSPDACSTEGEMRPTACGACGLAQEVCEAGAWVRGECRAEGVCLPGAVEEEDLSDCTVRSRICTALCEWTEFEIEGDPGTCERDAVRFVEDACGLATRQEQVCTAACEWEDVGECASACGTLRTEPPEVAEVCVPGGEFVRGSTTSFSTSPVTLVHVSTFAVGRYAVTNGAYLACRAAGACTGTWNVGLEAWLADPALVDHAVVGPSYAQAQEYCEWDGGRRLLTEAEFEKAVRGPAPRENIYPWDGDFYRCDLLPTRLCPGVPDVLPRSDPVTAFPEARSYYGVEGLFGGELSWVFDWADLLYYSDPDSLVDPTGPATPGPGVAARSIRGTRRVDARDFFVYQRRGTPPDQPSGIRCARSVAD